MLFILAALAEAPPSSAESCTLEAHGGEAQCKTCAATPSGRAACEELEKKGYMKMCKTQGTSDWTEVMCGVFIAPKGSKKPEPATKPEPKTPEPPAETSRCSVTGVGSMSALVFLLPWMFRRIRA